MASPYRTVGTNDRGIAVGHYSHRAKLTEQDVELIRQLLEGDKARGIKPMSLAKIAEKFDVKKMTISDIKRGVTHAQAPKRWRKVRK